jgi:hypothetical protein
VPLNLRKVVWLKTSGSQNLMSEHPNVYQDLLKVTFTKEIIEQIRIDIPRTFPENIYFDGKYKLNLYNLLAAYSHHNPVVGYCQGKKRLLVLQRITLVNCTSTS